MVVLARVLTYGAPMESDIHTQINTHAAVFRRVSAMPFRMNVLWCHEVVLVRPQTEQEIENSVKREKEGR